MNVLRCLSISVLAAASLMACDSGSTSGTGSATDTVPGDVAAADVQQGDVTADAIGAVTDASDAGVTVDDASDVATTDVAGQADVTEADSTSEEDADGGTASTPDLVVGEGSCTNDSDLEALSEFDMATEQMAIGMACYDMAGGPGQTSTEEVIACFKEKLASDYGFSAGCSGCISDHIICLQENCMDACMSSMMGGGTSPECTACIEDNGCNSDFAECSGLNPELFSP